MLGVFGFELGTDAQPEFQPPPKLTILIIGAFALKRAENGTEIS